MCVSQTKVEESKAWNAIEKQRGSKEPAWCRIFRGTHISRMGGQYSSYTKKDVKVQMCVNYQDLNKASHEDNFLLPHIDT